MERWWDKDMESKKSFLVMVVRFDVMLNKHVKDV